MIFEEKVKNALDTLPDPKEDDETTRLPPIEKTKSMPILENVKKVQSKVDLARKSTLSESK